jgi:hypothetical protein
MPFETFNSPPEPPEPPSPVHRCGVPAEQGIGAGSVWLCDICSTRWAFGQYDGWRFPITRFFRFLLWMVLNPFWLLGSWEHLSRWSRPRSTMGSVVEWIALTAFFAFGTLLAAQS